MARNDDVTRKFEEIRGELLKSPPVEAIQKMQLQVDLLANIDALMASDDPGHHHDHMDDHDHAHVFLGSIEQVERVERQ